MTNKQTKITIIIIIMIFVLGIIFFLVNKKKKDEPVKEEPKVEEKSDYEVDGTDIYGRTIVKKDNEKYILIEG